MYTHFVTGQHHSAEIQTKLQAVGIFNEIMRCKEEKELLMAEAQNLLQYYHRKILPAISEDILSKHIDKLKKKYSAQIFHYMRILDTDLCN